MSPYIFVLCMEVFTAIMGHRAALNEFRWHPRCNKVRLSHLVFADDLLIFTRADVKSAQAVKEALEEFHHLSGLAANTDKSEIFFGGTPPAIKEQILRILEFREGSFPVRYLGLPLVTGKLKRAQCLPLLEKIRGKLNLWYNKFLSFSGRLQLINSVLRGIQVYWTASFLIPITVHRSIDKIIARFLWGGMDEIRKIHKVAWDVCCLPREEGGLAILNSITFGQVGRVRIFWRAISNHSSVWAKWAKEVYLRKQSAWDAAPTTGASWIWKSILSCRELIKPLIRCEIGTGEDASSGLIIGPQGAL